MRHDASGTSRHVTAKSSICKPGGNAGMGAFCKSDAYAGNDSCVIAGDLRGASCLGGGAGRRETGAEDPAEVSRGNSRQRRGLPPTKPAEGPNGARKGLQERDGNVSGIECIASDPDEAHDLPAAAQSRLSRGALCARRDDLL